MSVVDFVGDEPSGGFNLPNLYNLVYCSRAVPGTDESEVDRIVAVAQRRNPANGITGLLVFGSGIFFQWLEGPRDHVKQLMTDIMRDPRHDTIVSLSESEEVRERLFPDWAMELVTTNDIRAVLEDAMDTSENLKSKQSLRLMLQQIEKSELT